ncbi:MAG: sulfite exporter TauE/SafE family protein [Pseudomonadota bacterium]|nr:sulfite exporter TauE/SafE family protein [Pseudomonadota bacterium]
MTWDQLAAISAAVFVGGFVQGATGVGFALIAAPVIGLLVPALLPACVLVLMLPLNVYVIWRERAALDKPGASWITLGRVAGTGGGLWVLVALSASQLGIFVGLATIAAVLATLLAPAFTPGRPALIASGVITGITETATGIGGPPLALVYQHQPVAVMRSTVALCFLVGELVSLATLVAVGRVGAPQLTAAAQLLPALGIGAVLSHAVHHKVNARFLRAFVLVFALVSGAVLIVRAL